MLSGKLYFLLSLLRSSLLGSPSLFILPMSVSPISSSKLTPACKNFVKTVPRATLSITDAIAENGGLDKQIDRKNVIVYRKYPEGIKKAQIDLTREDVQNSPYFWVQNGDTYMFNTRPRSFYGFGKEPIQTLTTGISLVTTALSIYLLFSRF